MQLLFALSLARLDFERGAVAGEVIYTIEGALTPTSQQEEEARIAMLAYAIKKLGNSEDAAEFVRCLNAICEEGDALEEVLEDCFGDYHLTAMRNNRSYRRFYTRIRRATDTGAIGELMKQAYEARQDDNLSVKHFIALNTAADNQRERLLSAPLSATAYRLIEEIVTASEKKLGYLGWAMYGDNNPSQFMSSSRL